MTCQISQDFYTMISIGIFCFLILAGGGILAYGVGKALELEQRGHAYRFSTDNEDGGT